MKTFICQMCGKEFESSANHATYCFDCRAERQRQRSKTYSDKVKNNIRTRTIGTSDICSECGKPYTVKSGSQKVCENCRRAYTNRRKQKTNKKYSIKTYDTVTAYLKKGEREKLKKICDEERISMSELINYGISLALKEIEEYNNERKNNDG